MGRNVFIGAAAGVAAIIAAIAVSMAALGGWQSAHALPNVTLGNTCVFSQSGSGLTLTANCAPTASIVIPSGLKLNGNGKTIDGSALAAPVIKNAAGSISNQVTGAKVIVGAGQVGIDFANVGGQIVGNTIDLAFQQYSIGIRVTKGLVTVQSNTILNGGKKSTGILATNASTTISSNNLSRPASDTFQWGVAIAGGVTTVQSNVFTNVSGAVFAVNASTSSYKSNTVDNALYGIITQTQGIASGGITIASNTLRSILFAGIGVATCDGGSTSNVTVTRNSVTANSTFGLIGIVLQGDGGLRCANTGAGLSGASVTWNTVAHILLFPLFVENATNVVQNYNTIIP